MQLTIKIGSKRLIFDSEIHGLKINKIEFVSGKDGILIFDKIHDIHANVVSLQMSTNTSTLIPALKILQVPYNSYFDERPVVESQNDITFYWNPTKLAAFYNLYSTDGMEYINREETIKKAVDLLISSAGNLPLKEEYLKKLSEPCKVLGFYRGFPIFDSSYGFAKLRCCLGIHIGREDITISTPMDKYESDIYELADEIRSLTQSSYTQKKNRAIFSKQNEILTLFGLKIAV